jgi:uncharacterized protein YukJ
VPYFVLEVNLCGKNKAIQKKLINQIGHEISFNTEYNVNGEFSDPNRNNNVYHLHFRRMKPNA